MNIFSDHERGTVTPPLTTLPWLDEPLNGGLRPGAAYLFAGAPGSNKTTLLAQMLTTLAAQRVPALVVLTEQSRDDLDVLFERINPQLGEPLARRMRECLAAEMLDDVATLPTLIRRRLPERYPRTQLIVVDSIQGSGLAATATRTYQQIFEFVDEARVRGITTCLISHVTKRGAIAGPKSLEHKVDVALILRKAMGYRQLFVAKNRFGPEVVEPLLLQVSQTGLAPSPHAAEALSSAVGYAGDGDELLEIQTAVSLPRLGGRGELNCPFLPAKRVRQLLGTVSGIPGIDISDLSYSIDAYIPNRRGYTPMADLPVALAMVSAYLRLPLPTDTLFAGQLDLRRVVRPPSAAYLGALAAALSNGATATVRRVMLSSGSVGMLEDLFVDEATRQAVEVVGVNTLDELLELLWPGTFGPARGRGATANHAGEVRPCSR